MVAPVVLEGRLVRLEPMRMEHLPALMEIAFDPGIWRWMRSLVRTGDDLRRWMESALADAAAGSAMPWVTIDRRSGKVAGSTRFMDIHRGNRTLEVGGTWLHPDYQRSGVNVEAKYLQLRHAFETMGAVRVALKTHHKNLKSQRAILALGAKPEGTFRNHMIMPDGSARHSMWFSIIREEWPEVKQQLEERMRHFG